MSSLFTSESVSEGHPDKVCDQLSDAILDAILTKDPLARVAAECFISDKLVVVGGEVTTTASYDVPAIVRQTLSDIGYTHPDFGFDLENCDIQCVIKEQSKDISLGVSEGSGLDPQLGAGDQGTMFGYACNQTDSFMPLPIHLAHRLMLQLCNERKSGNLPYLRPDAKSQVTVAYENGRPTRVDTVVLSTQHSPDVTLETLSEDVTRCVIKTVIPSYLLDEGTRFLINPTGRFVIGGPLSDVGLTGRKIIVDTYGGWARHGGGAFSGKDGTKVDRSASYMARYIAKNLVAASICEQVEVQLSYSIGISEPIAVYVNTFGTSSYSDDSLTNCIRSVFDLSISGIINHLELRRPIFKKTAVYGHFGRPDVDLSWERLDKVDVLKDFISKNHVHS